MTKNSTISVWHNSHWYIIYAMHYITFISQTTWKICFTIIMFKAVRQFCLLYLAINIYSICFSCKWYCMASFYPPSNRNYQCVCVIMNACFFVFLQKKNRFHRSHTFPSPIFSSQASVLFQQFIFVQFKMQSIS